MADTARPPQPTDRELEILTVLWRIKPATVRQVYEIINRGRRAEYSTILKLLQIMADNRLVLRDTKQRSHVYKAARPREWTQQQLTSHLLKTVFGSSPKALLTSVLSASKPGKSELSELCKVLDEYAKRAE